MALSNYVSMQGIIFRDEFVSDPLLFRDIVVLHNLFSIIVFFVF